MTDVGDILDELKRRRDELRVQIHLASKELKDEWDELEVKMDDLSGKARQFATDAKLKETGTGLGEAMKILAGELKLGYERIREALKSRPS